MEKTLINYADFEKLDIRIGTILEAEEVPGSEKLLKFLVDLGLLGQRTILSGIKKYFRPENMLGKQVLILVNLEPKKMMGLESQGMMLFGDINDEPILLMPQKEVPSGTEVK